MDVSKLNYCSLVCNFNGLFFSFAKKILLSYSHVTLLVVSLVIFFPACTLVVRRSSGTRLGLKRPHDPKL